MPSRVDGGAASRSPHPQQQEIPLSAEPIAVRRSSRLRLYTPFVLLLLLAVGWSIAWAVIRSRTVSGLDAWVAAEAANGRLWGCPERSVGGYPFRIEITCASLTLDRPDVSARLGRTLVVTQVYNPTHLIAEAAGPLVLTAGPDRVDATWRLLQASVITAAGQQRAALTTDDLRIRVASPERGDVDAAAARLELHGRPDPADPGAADLALNATGAVVPGLDALIGGTEPADIALVLAITRASDLPARPILAELDRWRQAGGRVDLVSGTLAKGPRRLEGKGQVAIDEARRPTGQLQLAAAGLGGLLGRIAGDRALGGALLGALLGGGQAEAPRQEAGGPKLRSLPPLRIDGGRLYLGPLPVPGLRVPALY